MKNFRYFKQLFFSACMLVAVALAVPNTLSAQEDQTVRIVYPLDFPDVQRVHFMLNTLNNLLKYYQDNLIDYEINIVAYGPGVQYLLKSDTGSGFKIMPYIHHGGPTGNGTAGRIGALLQLGGDNIHFYVCENTMKQRNVRADMLVDYAKTTPAGVVKVIDLQREGAALVKIR